MTRRPARRLASPLVALVVLVPAAARAWQTSVRDTPIAARPFAVTVDADGDVIGVGRLPQGQRDDVMVAKVAGSDGALRWQRTLTGVTGDVLRSVATDTAGNVVVGGRLTGTDPDFLVVRYGADGTLSWRRDLDGGAHQRDEAFAVAVDAAGNVLAAGDRTPTVADGIRFVVYKLAAADGSVLWERQLTHAVSGARAMVVAGEDVFAAGQAVEGIIVTKLAAATGEVAWTRVVPRFGQSVDNARAIAVGAGRVVVAARRFSAANEPDFAVVALDAATGTQLWEIARDGNATADADDALDIAIDAAGDVVACGNLTDADTDADAFVVKLAGATGDERWHHTINGGNGNDDVAREIALEPNGDVFLTGTIRNRNSRADVLLARLAGATGDEAWRRTLNGTSSANDQGFAVARTPDGDMVTAAQIRSGSATGGFAFVKRSAGGGDYPCGDGTEDQGEDCDDGNGTPGDGCRPDCTIEACGDGIRDPQEGCDDGGTAAGDCCSPTCTLEADDTPCDDANLCTFDDHCQEGACVAGAAVPCAPTDACDLASCDPAVGVCNHARRSEGAPCDDGDVCTVLDQCIGGSCTGSGAPTCRDNDPCTADACVAMTGCTFSAVTGFPSLTCLFERTTIGSGCPAGLPRAIATRLDRARKQATAAGASGQPRKVRRALNSARKALKQARRAADVQDRRGNLADPCATTLATTLADMLSTTEGLRAAAVAR